MNICYGSLRKLIQKLEQNSIYTVPMATVFQVPHWFTMPSLQLIKIPHLLEFTLASILIH